jgi:uncharacterized protein
MPINVNDPEYVKAEKEFYDANSSEEQLIALKKMISHMPKHKGAENLRQQLTTRRKKLEADIVKKKKLGKGVRQGVRKEDLQVVLVGKSNSGKSFLMTLLTNAKPEVAEYKFCTKEPVVGMMESCGVLIQMIENPAFGSEYYDKGLPHTADVILVVVDNFEDLKEIFEVLKIHKNKKLVVFNKIDLLEESEKRKLKARMESEKYNFILVSCLEGFNFEDLKKKIFSCFDVLRVYTKEPGKEKTSKPIILKPGAVVFDAAEKILKGFSKKVKETRIYGPSGKFLGQKVGLKHELKDLDVIEFKTG